MGDYDSPWKETLDRFFGPFTALLFPEVHAAIDWTRPYESLDTELQKIYREGEVGRRLADKLFRVWRKDGVETCVLVHVEMQSQTDDDFAERMFVYHYRIFDRFPGDVVCLAVLGDERPDWRPTEYERSLWGCTVRLSFPTAKLLDLAGKEAELERDPNPVALVVLAHLKSRAEDAARGTWKFRLVKGLFERGLSAEDVRQFFRLIDWLLILPEELERQFEDDLQHYEEEKKMPYITSIERRAMERGREKGREETRQMFLATINNLLNRKFGEAGSNLIAQIGAIQDHDKLQAILEVIGMTLDLEEVRKSI